ncbi:UNVERIFIED_CONTAM: hypothetical protein GTU68_042991, partial [Idotea baltica]|nr:hypothetical protein [Idotea baltica]
MLPKNIVLLPHFLSRNICLPLLAKKFNSRKFSTMKISEDQMKFVLKPGVIILSQIFSKNGFEIRLVGGAVRDLLMNIIPTDLDFATTATPKQMKNMFEEENIQMINLSGEKHGTMTARIEEENLECTTLNLGKEEIIDGIENYELWKLDAEKRDLTINALFLGLDGNVYDYFDGV